MRIEKPVAVVEQRVSNLAQGSACLVLMTGPFLKLLHWVPKGVLAGLFVSNHFLLLLDSETELRMLIASSRFPLPLFASSVVHGLGRSRWVGRHPSYPVPDKGQGPRPSRRTSACRSELSYLAVLDAGAYRVRSYDGTSRTSPLYGYLCSSISSALLRRLDKLAHSYPIESLPPSVPSSPALGNHPNHRCHRLPHRPRVRRPDASLPRPKAALHAGGARHPRQSDGVRSDDGERWGFHLGYRLVFFCLTIYLNPFSDSPGTS
jgi:hypothetical protein